MDERTMFELLEIYDAAKGVEEIEEMLIGQIIGAGPGEGIVGNLSYVSGIIARYSPVYGPGEDYEMSYFWRTLDDDSIDNHRKARLLLGIAE